MLEGKYVQILLSTYNGEKYLAEQLESYTRLSGYDHIKVLIRDDGSTDGTRNILRRYHEKEGFEILLGENVGINASYRELLKRSDPGCRYFAFSDQDDVWLPEKLALAEQALARCDDGKPLLFASRSRLVDMALQPIGETPALRYPPSFYNAMVQNVCPGHTQVLNRKLRDLLVKGDVLKAYVLDWWVYLVASGTGEIVFSEECTVLHRQHRQNAVGYQTNQLRLFFSRLNRVRSGEAAQIARQLEGLLVCYGGVLSEPFRRELRRFLDSQETAPARLRYAVTGRCWRQTLGETLLVHFLYACGKYRIKD